MRLWTLLYLLHNILSIWLACFYIAIQNHRPNFDREMEFNVTATDMTKMNGRNKTQFLTLFMYYAASEMMGLCKVTGYIIPILSCWNNWHAIGYINPPSQCILFTKLSLKISIEFLVTKIHSVEFYNSVEFHRIPQSQKNHCYPFLLPLSLWHCAIFYRRSSRFKDHVIVNSV